MAVPIKEDAGLVGETVRGNLYFEGRTFADCLKALEQAVERISKGFDVGENYIRGETAEVGYYSFEVEDGD